MDHWEHHEDAYHVVWSEEEERWELPEEPDDPCRECRSGEHLRCLTTWEGTASRCPCYLTDPDRHHLHVVTGD